MNDIVERLRDQGRDAFARHYSLGMFKLCAEAADEIERLKADNDRLRRTAGEPSLPDALPKGASDKNGKD